MHIPAAISPPERLLLGPGPSNVAPSVSAAMSKPLLGHLDRAFVAIMDEIKAMLRHVLRTNNAMTFPVSGTGSAGMEFCFVNLIEPGDEVVVGINGVFGGRMAEVARRCGAKVVEVRSDWGTIVTPDQLAAALEGRRPKLVAIVHAETSTGAETPVAPLAALAHAAGALFLLDTVTSAGGSPVETDAWGVDALYSGTQKCLGCPPGLAPVSLNERALDVARNRKTPVQSWYLDVNLLASYWGSDRTYHHTAPVSMNYALHEALRLICEEGLEPRFERHRRAHERLKANLHAMGLGIASQPGHQLWQLNAIGIPEGADDAAVRNRLLSDFGIEVGAGLGPLKGKIWRVGLMGENARPEVVDRLTDALKQCL